MAAGAGEMRRNFLKSSLMKNSCAQAFHIPLQSMLGATPTPPSPVRPATHCQPGRRGRSLPHLFQAAHINNSRSARGIRTKRRPWSPALQYRPWCTFASLACCRPRVPCMQARVQVIRRPHALSMRWSAGVSQAEGCDRQIITASLALRRPPPPRESTQNGSSSPLVNTVPLTSV